MRPSLFLRIARSGRPAVFALACLPVAVGPLARAGGGVGRAEAAPSAIAAPGAAPGGSPVARSHGVRQETGTIEGRVTLYGNDGGVPPRLSPYSRRRYTPPVQPVGGATSSGVVAFVRAPGPRAAPRAARVIQRNLAILPRLTVIEAGARVDFPNQDDVFHNLFSLSDPTPFNLGRYQPGESRSRVFDKAGTLRMFCDIHPEMDGTILVLDTPYFAVADAEGWYRLDDVPAGDRLLVVWHGTAGSDSAWIRVSPGAVARLDLTLGAP